MNEHLICPLCGEKCKFQNGVASCSQHFKLDGNGVPLEVMLFQLAYCWENMPFEKIVKGTQTKFLSTDTTTYIKQTKGRWKIEAEGKFKDIIGLFGAFSKLRS